MVSLETIFTQQKIDSAGSISTYTYMNEFAQYVEILSAEPIFVAKRNFFDEELGALLRWPYG